MDDRSASGPLLQTFQRHVAEIHARALRRHRDSQEFFQPRHIDRPGAFSEPRRLDLHESSAALPGRDILSGGVSKGRSSDNSAGGAQPELHCALCCVRDRSFRVACAIRLSSCRIFTATTEHNRMKRSLPWIILAVAAGWTAANWLPSKTAKDDLDLTRFGEIP